MGEAPQPLSGLQQPITSQPPLFDVIIVGGGVVGLSAALAMREHYASVALVDNGSLIADIHSLNQRAYALNEASCAFLETLGVWTQINPEQLSPYEKMHVWDAANGAYLDFDARLVGHSQLGVIVEASILKQALLEQVSSRGIVCFPHTTVSAVQSIPAGVLLEAGPHHLHARLLMVADGATSHTRELLGVSLTSWPYHQQAIVATVQTEKSHQHTAYQVFYPEGPLAFLPLPSLHQCSIVWSTTPARAAELMALTEADFNEQLTKAFSARLGACKLTGQRGCFPLHMRHAKQYSGAAWLLMGDAAHTIHPLAGLGLNIGLADVSAWRTLLQKNPHHGWSQHTLAAYQRQRKHAVWQMISLMEGLNAFFSNASPPVVGLRGLGLQLCHHLPLLKKWLIYFARGAG